MTGWKAQRRQADGNIRYCLNCATPIHDDYIVHILGSIGGRAYHVECEPNLPREESHEKGTD